jgi:hypothetical protein
LIVLFKKYVQQAAAIAGGPGGWFEQEITKEYNQIRQAVYDDSYKMCYTNPTEPKFCSNEEFEAEVAYMIQFAENRAAIVLGQLSEH